MSFIKPKIIVRFSIMLLFMTTVLFPHTVNAADPANFIDKTRIQFRGNTYVDVSPYDSTYNWKFDDCEIDIDDLANPDSDYTVEVKEGDDCKRLAVGDAFFTNTQRRFNTGYRLDAEHIFVPIPSEKKTQSGLCLNRQDEDYLSEEPGVYERPPVDQRRQDNIYHLQEPDELESEASLETLGGSSARITGTFDCNSIDTRSYDVILANNGDATEPPVEEYGTVASILSPLDGGDPGVECEGGAFGWLVCGTINFVKGAVNKFAQVIEDLLRINPLTTTLVDDSGDVVRDASGNPRESDVFAVWKNIRNLANVLLIPVFFVLIFSQALSINIDAYTIKKMLPRLVAAAILIQFSFFAMQIAVDISNILGDGMRDLVLAPVQGSEIAIQFSSAGGLVAVGAIIAAVAAVFSAGLFLLLIPLILAIAGVYLTLVFRHILIVVLAIMAPVAFVAWVLPNTERVYKLWQDLLLKALLMYPIIMLLFAGGTIVAVIATGGSIEESGAARNLMALAAIVVPLLLVPATFKLGGTAMAAFAGGMQRLQGVAGARAKQPFEGRKKRLDEIKAARKEQKWAGRAARGGVLGAAAGVRQYGSREMALHGGRSKTEAHLGAMENLRKRGEQLKGLSTDQLDLLAYGSSKAALAEASILRSTGDAGDTQKAGALESNVERNWKTVAPLAQDPLNAAAAFAARAGDGFANEAQFRATKQNLQNNPQMRDSIVDKAAFDMKEKGSSEFLPFVSTMTPQNQSRLISNLGVEGIQKQKNFSALTPILNQAMAETDADGNPVHRDNLLGDLTAAYYNESTSTRRRTEIAEYMATQHKIDVAQAPPPTPRTPTPVYTVEPPNQKGGKR